MERAGAHARRVGAHCRTAAVNAHRQADQCRLPKCGFNPAREHHDARTYVACTEAAGYGHRGTGAVAASGACGIAGARCGQEAGSKARACGAGPDRACRRARGTAAAGTGACGFERLMLFKARAGR